MAQNLMTDTIFEDGGKYFVQIEMPSDELQDLDHPTTFGCTEDAGPFDSLEEARTFEAGRKNKEKIYFSRWTVTPIQRGLLLVTDGNIPNHGVPITETEDEQLHAASDAKRFLTLLDRFLNTPPGK